MLRGLAGKLYELFRNSFCCGFLLRVITEESNTLYPLVFSWAKIDNTDKKVKEKNFNKLDFCVRARMKI